MSDMQFRNLAPMQHSDKITVKKIKGKGRGVFARCPLRKGAVIEVVPLLIVPVREFVDGWSNAFLQKYCYVWTRSSVAVCLGYGSLYNHSFEPNANYEHGDNVILFRAIRAIAEGEEITINYNGDPEDQSPVSFKVV